MENFKRLAILTPNASCIKFLKISIPKFPFFEVSFAWHQKRDLTIKVFGECEKII